MNKKLGMAVAGAVMAFGATAANAGITIPAGDWTIDIGGNVNAFYSHTKVSGDYEDVLDAAGLDDTISDIQTGLLPSAIGIGGKTRQNDLDIAFQFTFFTGANSGTQSAAGSNTLNIRQAYMTFGDASWGSIKMGRDLGIFGSDAILSDMTLLGVGVGHGYNLESSTLGRIGSGYIYADWIGQISYHSPNWNGFSFSLGVREPWSNGTSNSGVGPIGGYTIRNDLGFEGKASYEWAGDISGKVWAGFVTQKHSTDTGAIDSYRSEGWELGGKVATSGFEVVGYYYDGDGLDSQYPIIGAGIGGLQFLTSLETEDHGGYVQATYKLPGIGTKLGVSYGENNSELKDTPLDIKNSSWMIGAYHPLTKSLNLVVEYVDQEIEEDFFDVNLKAKTLSLGAIMFF